MRPHCRALGAMCLCRTTCAPLRAAQYMCKQALCLIATRCRLHMHLIFRPSHPRSVSLTIVYVRVCVCVCYGGGEADAEHVGQRTTGRAYLDLSAPGAPRCLSPCLPLSFGCCCRTAGAEKGGGNAPFSADRRKQRGGLLQGRRRTEAWSQGSTFKEEPLRVPPCMLL